MARHPARFAALLAVLALLLPLADLGECADCLWADSPDCCGPSCCSCCLHSSSVLTATAWGLPFPSLVAEVPGPQKNSAPSFHPRGVFHVPKPALA